MSILTYLIVHVECHFIDRLVRNYIDTFFSFHSISITPALSKVIRVRVIQRSAINTASYVVMASGLHSYNPIYKIMKYADDTYLLISAPKVSSCADEIQYIGDWAMKNKLTLKRKKSVEIFITLSSHLQDGDIKLSFHLRLFVISKELNH